LQPTTIRPDTRFQQSNSLTRSTKKSFESKTSWADEDMINIKFQSRRPPVLYQISEAESSLIPRDVWSGISTFDDVMHMRKVIIDDETLEAGKDKSISLPFN
jgi:hypothetical protein